MDINSRNLGQQEEDLDKKKFRKRASMSRPTAHVPEVQMPMFAKILPFLSQIEFCPFLQDFDYFEMVAMTAMVANTPMLAPCPIIVQL